MLQINLCFLPLIALLLLHSPAAANSEWGYPNMDAEEDFPKWGGLCDNGINQSPIDLSMRGAFKSDFNQLRFYNYQEKQTDVTMVNNGHTIQLSDFAKPMKIDGGPLDAEYHVEQLHFHWWSEHTINNIRYPLECHVVHRNRRYPNMTEAAKYKDGIAVVAVLYHVSNKPNDAIEDVLEYIDAVKSYDQINKPVTMKDFSVSELLPEVDGYFTYAGSLTTPACAESVTWLILHETFPVTLEQVDKFKDIEFDDGKALRNNYRSIQKSHNRAVIAVMYDSDNTDRDNSAVGLHISLAVVASFIAANLML